MNEDIVEAMGEWLMARRRWSLWGTLTIDPRRRQGEPVETRSPRIVEWQEQAAGGYLPESWGGGCVLYERRLDSPSSMLLRERDQVGDSRPVPRDSLVWMIETAMQAASRKLKRRVDWAACLEEFKTGNLHAHCLMYSGQLGEGRNDITALHKPWFSLAGYCKLEAPRDNMAVSVYIAKYLCKPKGELLFSRKLHLRAEPEFSRLSVNG
jgi:hypothetical protein